MKLAIDRYNDLVLKSRLRSMLKKEGQTEYTLSDVEIVLYGEDMDPYHCYEHTFIPQSEKGEGNPVVVDFVVPLCGFYQNEMYGMEYHSGDGWTCFSDEQTSDADKLIAHLSDIGYTRELMLHLSDTLERLVLEEDQQHIDDRFDEFRYHFPEFKTMKAVGYGRVNVTLQSGFTFEGYDLNVLEQKLAVAKEPQTSK